MATYLEATTVDSATTIQAQLYTDLAAEGVAITGFSATSAERGLVALDARAIAYEQAIRAEVTKAGFLVDVESRDEAWIDRMVYGFFRVERLQATYARHVFTLTNQSATGGPYTVKAAGSPGAGASLEAQAADATRFRNITGGTLAAGVGEELILEFEALTSGLAGNIGPGEIFKILGGALPGVDISNGAESITQAARAKETNREYVNRALARWGTLAAGGHPLAVEFRILSGVETITKIGVRDDNPNGPGSVDVYLANATGPATNDECTAAETAFGPYEPLGSRGLWRYLPAIAKTVTVTGNVELNGENEDAIADAEAALESLSAQWPMRAGIKLDASLVHGIITGGDYEQYSLPGFRGVADLDLSSPLDDTLLDVAEVLVFVINLTEV
jgi:hypothetical protein